MDTKTARERKGWSQTLLASKGKTDQGTISAVERGRVSLSDNLSKRLGVTLGVSGDELIFENRARAMERAIKEGDAAAVLNAAKTLVKVAGRHNLTPVGEKRLNDLVERAVKFAQGDNLNFEDNEDDGEDDLNEGRFPAPVFLAYGLQPATPCALAQTLTRP